jgi:hypothetical protein
VEPSSDRPAGSGASALKRWGPLAAIVVVIAIVVAVVVAGGDDDDGTDTAGPGNGDGEVVGGGGEPPAGAISWTRAQEEGLDLEWGEGCDTETGRVALPYYFAPECYADAEPSPDAPAVRGVTDDEIVVVVYQSQENDPVLNFITGAIANDDTNADVADTYRGYVELFESAMQTYGRSVRLEFMTGSGITTDEVSARADAVRAAEELGAFAVWGGPVLSNAWTQELHARGVVCLSCPAIADPAPYAYTITASPAQTRAHLVEYLSKRLAGKPAEHAGDPAMHDQERVFGHLIIDTGSQESRDNQTNMRADLAAEGIELAEQIGYELDPARLQEQAGSAIARMKAAGITTVIFQGDPVAPTAFTQEATAQEWFPEWVIGGSALVDATAFARTYDQAQWANAFGISSLSARAVPEVSSAWHLYTWFHGEPPPAIDTATVLYPQPSLFYAGVQAAGPDLTPESFRDGLFSINVLGGAVTQPTVTYGERGFWDGPDHHGIDDFTELWWDTETEGPDEIRKVGPGMYRYVEGGRRFLPGEWTAESGAFVMEGSVAIYDEVPEGERPRDYPPPR